MAASIVEGKAVGWCADFGIVPARKDPPTTMYRYDEAIQDYKVTKQL